jgi:hypothetical protein
MSTKQLVLEEIQQNRFLLTKHARTRMNERGVDRLDIVECGWNGQIDELDNKFIILGFGIDDEPLKIVCAYRDGVLIITVY